MPGIEAKLRSEQSARLLTQQGEAMLKRGKEEGNRHQLVGFPDCWTSTFGHTGCR